MLADYFHHQISHFKKTFFFFKYQQKSEEINVRCLCNISGAIFKHLIKNCQKTQDRLNPSIELTQKMLKLFLSADYRFP